jgi:hypothetical protein
MTIMAQRGFDRAGESLDNESFAFLGVGGSDSEDEGNCSDGNKIAESDGGQLEYDRKPSHVLTGSNNAAIIAAASAQYAHIPYSNMHERDAVPNNKVRMRLFLLLATGGTQACPTIQADVNVDDTVLYG